MLCNANGNLLLANTQRQIQIACNSFVPCIFTYIHICITIVFSFFSGKTSQRTFKPSNSKRFCVFVKEGNENYKAVNQKKPGEK